LGSNWPWRSAATIFNYLLYIVISQSKFISKLSFEENWQHGQRRAGQGGRHQQFSKASATVILPCKFSSKLILKSFFQQGQRRASYGAWRRVCPRSA